MVVVKKVKKFDVMEKNRPQIFFFDEKKLEVGDFSSYQFCQFFSPFFLQQPPPLCKYFIFAANKLLPKGMNLFLILSRHIKSPNFVRKRMLHAGWAKHEVVYRVRRFLWPRW